MKRLRPPISPSAVDRGEVATTAGHGARPRAAFHFWEVICLDCGDSEGLLENQVDEIKRLRGPYLTEDKAKKAAALHNLGLGPRDQGALMIGLLFAAHSTAPWENILIPVALIGVRMIAASGGRRLSLIHI